MRIFLSSTFIDLEEHRKMATEALERLGQQGIRMEIFGARPEEPVKACLAEIEACDIFVGIYAHRYGFIPPDSGISITEAEYDHSEKAIKPIFCYIVDENYPWPPKLIEGDPGKSKLEIFKKRISLNTVRETFTTPENLALKIATSIGRYLSQGSPVERKKEFDQVAAVSYRGKDDSVEFLLIKTSGRRWMFPKGGVEGGESNARAVQREAFEEAGALGNVSSEHFTIFRHLKRDLKRKGVELKVAAFLFEVRSTQKPAEENREPTWFSPEKAEDALSENREFEYAEELKRVVREACAAIGK